MTAIPSPIVDTRQGRVRGGPGLKGGLAFKGVPFAASTAGSGRFRPPAPPTPWTGVREATQIGPIAPQNAPEFNLSALPAMSEDCLNLNIFTPAADSGRRPVLVYIHAGAFISGSGAGSTQDGSRLASDEDVVVVTINYRLGVFGWPPFRAHGEAVSNDLGLLDQIAALEWLRDNIEGFGGDPANVTLFGYSAGGWSILALMAAPRAAGLFHKAAPQSGSEFTAGPRARQDLVAELFLARLGQDPTQASMADLLAAQEAVAEALKNDPARRLDEGLTFGPWLDGQVLTQPPIEAVRDGVAAPVPMLIGTTADELGYAPFRAGLPWLEALHSRAASLESLAAAYGQAAAEAIWSAYATAAPDASEAVIAGHIRSDRYYRLPAVQVAEAQSARAPTWMYQFTLAADAAVVGGVSTHASDLAFWLGTMAGSPLQGFLFDRAPSEAEEALSGRMRRDLARFARTGACDWPAYAPESRATRLYGLTDALALDPGGDQRRAWPAAR